MQRFSIARSLRLALFGLTVVMAVIAGLGIASLYSARQRYENTLARSADVGSAAANLAAAAVEQVGVLRTAAASSTPAATAARRSAARAVSAAAAGARSLASGDPATERLVAAELTAVQRAGALASTGHAGAAAAAGGPLARVSRLATAVQQRQTVRQHAAQSLARSDSRRAVILVAVAGVFALLAALGLITALVASMRRPLDELVRATGALAAGALRERVNPSGPRELRELGTAFNAMASDLARAQARLEDERQRLAVTIESLGDALLVTEPVTSQIATANPRAAELLPELTPGSAVDGPSSPLPPLDDALAGEVVVEHRGRSLAVTAAHLGGEEAGIVWTVRDMTERARLERAKSEFVATASHELRSPLTSIKGFVELLARSPEDMSDRQREFVDIILRSTDRLVELVADLLDVARIEADRVELDRQPIDAGEAVREVVELMGPRIAEKGQRLGTYIAPRLPLALADAGRLRQILANLLTNAHLYTPEGGRIHVGVEPERAWIQLVVADNGVGMDEEERQRVFERFFRAGDGSRSSTGTGLGLSIVKSLVELHHGEIEFDSEPGRGTTFRVRIPAAGAALVAPRTLEVIRGRRVLVVDDEPEIAELIVDQLAPFDVHANVATSGEEALQRMRAEHFDAVTLDILMPGQDGFDVLREIRADPELRAMPIVFVSVFSGHERLSGEWTVGKPIDADELRSVLAAAVQGGRSRVLVVGREELQDVLEPALDDLGIEHEWELSGPAAARVCSERRFEVALVDIGVRNPQAVLQALDLRGRRLRRAVILFGDQGTVMPPGMGSLGMEVVPVQEAAAALLATLRGERGG